MRCVCTRIGTELNSTTTSTCPETRPVPDTIMIAGLLFHYSTQQASDKQETYGAQFIRMINQELWRRLERQHKNPDESNGQRHQPTKTTLPSRLTKTTGLLRTNG